MRAVNGGGNSIHRIIIIITIIITTNTNTNTITIIIIRPVIIRRNRTLTTTLSLP